MNIDNPCGLDGFAFLEFSAPDSTLLHNQFKAMGFVEDARHMHEDICRYKHGNIDFFVNNSKNTQADTHARAHGAGACAMGFRVADARQAYEYVISKGATPFEDARHAHHFLPAIEAIGGSVIYFVDDNHQPFSHLLKQSTTSTPNQTLSNIDHLTHNVHQGNMDYWANFYERLFNFKEIRFFDITGKMTGLLSRAMGSPCGKIKIPLNESKDTQSQIEEFIHEYKGEGIQHIALSTDDIYHAVQTLKSQGVPFLDVPDTYYEAIESRIPWHQEPVQRLKQLKLLIDGETDRKYGLLLQIFTENIFGPVFFEIIQRKGNDGFGEGNFQALFEAIERDQIRRGTLVE